MKLRILHLEDNAVDADLVRMSLLRGGLDCDILPVASGSDFMAALQKSEFDLILSDSGVPGFSGEAALAAAYEQLPGVPFIIVSGFAGAAGIDRPAAAGAVPKSQLEKLVPVIRKTLRGADEQLESASYVWGMQQLVSAAQRLALARNRQSVVDITCHSARSLVGADGCCFILRDGDQCEYVAEEAIGPLWKGRRFPLGACVSGWTMINRQPAVIKDINDDARVPLEHYRNTFVKSLVMLPIRTLAPVGAIGVYWARPHRASSEEVELLESLADSTAVALESVELLDSLEQRAAQRTAELQRRSAELAVLNRELESFVHSVVHDLRSPLITIDGFTQVLRESCSEHLDETGRDHLERISAGARRMHRLINDLLELSKVVRAPMQPVSVDLSRTATEIAERLRANAPDRQVTVSIAPNLRAKADPTLLRMALEHLFSNALKFTSRTANARVELGVRTERSGRQAFFIRDNGAGFDPRYAGKLFSPFCRLHPEAQFPGSGIGLAMVQRVVHRHGGEVWAEATPGQGACVHFTLPLA